MSIFEDKSDLVYADRELYEAMKRAWCELTDEERDHYRFMATKERDVTTPSETR